MRTFEGFLNSKQIEAKEHLHILLKILGKAGFKTDNHLDDQKEPYIYVRKPDGLENLSFGGIRIYNRGKNSICYRVQNKETTEPYGTSYSLDVESMFKDLSSGNKDIIGYRIIFYIIQELKNFFINSEDVEKEKDDDSQMGVIAGTMGAGDYSNQVQGNDVNRR